MASACDSRRENYHVPAAALRRAEGEAKLARKTIEELPDLSFTTQSRFFRLFEWLEECMDYAAESIRYEEYDAAKIDLCRSRRGIRDAVTLLTTHTGIKAPKPIARYALFQWAHRRPEKRARHPAREQAKPKHTAEIIHLLPNPEVPSTPPEPRPKLMLM